MRDVLAWHAAQLSAASPCRVLASTLRPAQTRAAAALPRGACSVHQRRSTGWDPTSWPYISAMRDGRAAGRGQVRTLVQRELAAALGDWDLLLSPAAPTTAFRVGEARRPRQV